MSDLLHKAKAITSFVILNEITISFKIYLILLQSLMKQSSKIYKNSLFLCYYFKKIIFFA